MVQYLITGGGGFIGSNLVAALIEHGSVRVLDNFSTGHRQNLVPFIDKIEVVEGDICDYHTVQAAVKGVDYVLHQAALPSVPRSVYDPLTTNRINVNGTLNVLYAAKEAGVKRLVYAASSSAYGHNPQLPKKEDMSTQPASPYAISKLTGEQYCQVFWELYGFETVCLRYFNVFGLRQDPNSQYAAVIPKFIKALLNNQPITIFGDGKQSRDFTFIDNVVQANLKACTVPDVGGEVFNIACGKSYTLLDLVMLLENIVNLKGQVTHLEARLGDVLHSHADIRKAQRMLNYVPDVDFEEGLRRTVAWFR